MLQEKTVGDHKALHVMRGHSVTCGHQAQSIMLNFSFPRHRVHNVTVFYHHFMLVLFSTFWRSRRASTYKKTSKKGSGEFYPLHIPCWLHFYLVCFSYTSHAGFIFIWVGSFSYTSHACFTLVWGVSLTHSVLASFLCGEFLLHIPY